MLHRTQIQIHQVIKAHQVMAITSLMMHSSDDLSLIIKVDSLAHSLYLGLHHHF